MNFLCLSAQFYVALYPVGGPYLTATTFFKDYLAGPFLLILYVGWKTWSWSRYPAHRPLYVKITDIDIYTGIREGHIDLSEAQRRQTVREIQEGQKKKGVWNWAKAVVTSVF